MYRLAQWTKCRTNRLIIGCLAFLAGLAAARKGFYAPGWSVAMLAVCLPAVRRRPLIYMCLLAAAAGSAGMWRGDAYMKRLEPYTTHARQQVIMEAIASTDAVYGDKGQLSFEANNVSFVGDDGGTGEAAPGTIKVSGFGELAVYKGDRLQITGKLYPTRGSKQAGISYATIQRLGSNQSFSDVLRRKFAAGIQTALPEPQASFGLGLLVGQRNTLPDETSQALKMVGLTHIIAVSGYNLTILVEASKRLMVRRSKRMTVLLAASLIFVFLTMTGLSASIVRAAVVSGLGMAAWYYGRPVRPMVLILLAAAITAYANPVYLWSDIGWYLSFLAFFGILVLAPALKKRFFSRQQLPVLGQVALETVSAELMTIPLVMFIFGQVSLVGLAANMLVVTVIPLAMLFSFLAGVFGAIVPLLAGWISVPAKLLLTYMLDMATLLSGLPHVFRTNMYITAIDMLLCYGGVGVLILLLRRKPKTLFDT